jgi:feruloyl esterase
MARAGDTLSELARRRREAMAFGRQHAGKPGGAPGEPSRLTETTEFGTNPGYLKMWSYAPKDLPRKAPLVVVLHGCTQTAAAYDASAGWSRLADREGFAVLYPEQRPANNPSRCFNWFRLSDASRGLGEALSIREMVEAIVERHGLDDRRVFVTGLSAGGAMTSAMLASYPDVFAGGAILAGLPHGTAASIGEAVSSMSGANPQDAGEWGDRVRAASTHSGPWPVVSIWHGTADGTVTPKNGDELVKQWVDVHRVPPEDFREETRGGLRRRVWSSGGRDVVEYCTVAGMGHGVPVDGKSDEKAGPHMFDVGLSSTVRIAAFWGVGAPATEFGARDAAAERERAAPRPSAQAGPRGTNGAGARRPAAAAQAERPRTGFAGRMNEGGAKSGASAGRMDVGSVIARALRAAGLMK